MARAEMGHVWETRRAVPPVFRARGFLLFASNRRRIILSTGAIFSVPYLGGARFEGSGLPNPASPESGDTNTLASPLSPVGNSREHPSIHCVDSGMTYRPKTIVYVTPEEMCS